MENFKDFVHKNLNEAKPSEYYEKQADKLSGKDKERALNAAIKNLDKTSDTFIDDFKRLKKKLSDK